MPGRFQFYQRREYFEGIPTVVQWQNITKITTLGYTHSRTNTHLLAIDLALRNFAQNLLIPFNRSRESAEAIKTRERIIALLLLDLAKKCAIWLESKADVKKSNRRKHVTNLLMETQKALAILDLTLPLATTHKKGVPLKQSEQLGSVAAKIRWIQVREGLKHLGVGRKKKALDPHYWAETNIGGANPDHIQGGTLNAEWQQSSEKFLFNFTRLRAQQKGTAASVKYVDPAERWRYQIVFDREGKMYKKKSKHSNATDLTALIDNGTTGWIFIIDEDGNCYTSFGEHPGDGKLFHHSSIMSGVGVLFAGAIGVEMGVLKEIDNASGHYKPGKEHLLNALKILVRKKVPLIGVRIVYLAGMKQMGGMEVPAFEMYNDAAKFLRTNGRTAPDQRG